MPRGYPERVYIFDVNGTLDCDANPEKGFVLPTKKIFSFLQGLNGVWAGTWSGMYPWMQLQKVCAAGACPDFVIFKTEAVALQDSIVKIFNKNSTKYFVIGNADEDKLFAYNFHFDYFDREEFFEIYNKGVIK